MKGASSLRCLLLLLLVLAVGLRAQEKPAGEPEKSGNWLIDAMGQQPAGARDDAKNGAMPADAGRRANAARAGTKPEDEEGNPLSSYLKTWITPRDYDLLKPKDSANTPRGATAGTGRDAMVPPGLTPGLHANPYLPGPDSSNPASPKAPPSPLAAKPAAPASLVAKDDAAPAKAAGPPAEVRKTQDDAKYFPQLKRF